MVIHRHVEQLLRTGGGGRVHDVAIARQIGERALAERGHVGAAAAGRCKA